jgi:parallel beta-helix repeat protein
VNIKSVRNRFPRQPALTCIPVALWALGLSLPQLGKAQRAVNVRPADNVQALIQNSPPGTTFHFEPGVYRLLQIRPKDRDSFLGDNSSAILSGAVVLTEFRTVGSLFRAHYNPPKEQLAGLCTTDHPMCKYPEDCFLDNKPLLRVADLSAVRSGGWFLDYATLEVVLADDPKGHSVEVSTARSAFAGAATGVEISGLTIEKYAVPAQMGAIGDQNSGVGWKITNCTVRWNHGTGIQVSGDSLVAMNKVLQNGQKGVGASGNNIIIKDNEIAFNNFGGFRWGWEAGGTKFSQTTELKVTGNNVHDNEGPGLWTDGDNRDTLYEANTVTNNSGDGIKHEISFSVNIRGNTVSGNGRSLNVWLWGSQILIQNSSDADVSHNTVIVPRGYGNGIGIILQNRGASKRSAVPYTGANNVVHDNDVTYLDPKSGASGVVCDYEPYATFIDTNHFDNNHYHVIETRGSHWMWKKWHTWESLREAGQETHGTIDNSSAFSHDAVAPVHQ